MTAYRRQVEAVQVETGDLSLAEMGARDRLLDHYYATGGAFSDDAETWARICRAVTDSEKGAVFVAVERFFPTFPDGLRHNLQADHEIRLALQAIESGAKGGRKPSNTQTSADTSIQTSFTEFWAAYPRKVARAAAFKCWKRIAPDPEVLQTILERLGAQVRSPQWSEARFIPHASTWLNGRRWEDEIAVNVPAPAVLPRSSVAAANASAAETWLGGTNLFEGFAPVVANGEITIPADDDPEDDDPPEAPTSPPWTETGEGIMAKGRELAILPFSAETYEAYRDRLLAELDRRRLRDETKRQLSPQQP
jgi:uncharacterized protein YdaU (DUF1376 family)